MLVQPSLALPERAPDSGETTAVRLVQVYVVTLFVFPSTAVVGVIGASGYVASLVGMACFLVWAAASALGFHNPTRFRYPVRIGVGLMWVASLASYAVFTTYVQPAASLLAADRWMLQLLSVTGVVFVLAEGVHTRAAVNRVVGTIVIAGSLSSGVAMVQYFFGVNLAAYPAMTPGLTENASLDSIQFRAGLSRVAGTAIHPIEFGVVCGLLLPLALWLALFVWPRWHLRSWVPVALLLFGVATSVSRSAVVTVVVAMAVFVVLLPVRERAIVLLLAPLGLVGVFMAAPGFLRTMQTFFVEAPTDPSIQSRTDDYPMAQRLVLEAPWFGSGPNNYLPNTMLEIFDNQYLLTAVTLGLVGLAALIAFLALPAWTALAARRDFEDDAFRSLGAAVAGAAMATLVTSFTFDSLSFPQFVGVQACIAGLAGSLWCAAARKDPWRPRISEVVGNGSRRKTSWT